MRYNFVEKKLAYCFSKVPVLKRLVKLIYMRLMYLKNKKEYACSCKYDLRKIDFRNKESFFGYYDKRPLSNDGFLLCYLTESETRKDPDPEKPLTIVLFAPDQSAPIWQFETYAYNWQQGARAQWLNDDLFIFNDFDPKERKYISRVFSKANFQPKKCFNFPVQDSFSTKYFLTLNYKRLSALSPDYGYQNLGPLNRRQLEELQKDGIWRIEYATGENRLLVSLSDVRDLETKPEFKKALHSVNHIMISPSGKEFVFIHRFYFRKRRYDRMILANAENGDLTVLSDRGMVSHYYWVNERNILAYLRGPRNKEAYWMINLKNLKFSRFARGVLDKYGDGHPHINGKWCVTDTYPDKARLQKIFLYNLETREKETLGEFFHGFTYSGVNRCDLHPRFGKDNKKLFFDSVFSGKRKLYMMELDK